MGTTTATHLELRIFISIELPLAVRLIIPFDPFIAEFVLRNTHHCVILLTVPIRRPKGPGGGQFAPSARPQDPDADLGTRALIGLRSPLPDEIADFFAQSDRTIIHYDKDGNYYDEDGNPLPEDYDLSGTFARPLTPKDAPPPRPLPPLMTPNEIAAEVDRIYDQRWPMGTWPKHPDTFDEDNADPDQIEHVFQWMRKGYDDAMQRSIAAQRSLSPQDEQALISWGARDTYFGPLMRGYTGLTNEELDNAGALHPLIQSTLVYVARGSQNFPSDEEWKGIYEELQALEQAQSDSADSD